jgi:hypothetical protein
VGLLPKFNIKPLPAVAPITTVVIDSLLANPTGADE